MGLFLKFFQYVSSSLLSKMVFLLIKRSKFSHQLSFRVKQDLFQWGKWKVTGLELISSNSQTIYKKYGMRFWRYWSAILCCITMQVRDNRYTLFMLRVQLGDFLNFSAVGITNELPFNFISLTALAPTKEIKRISVVCRLSGILLIPLTTPPSWDRLYHLTTLLRSKYFTKK